MLGHSHTIPDMLTRTLVPVALAAALALAGCAKEDPDTATDPTSDSPGETSSASASASETAASDTAQAAGDCTYTEDGSSPAKKVELPGGTPADDGDVPVAITLNSGKLALTLDGGGAPCTVNSFVSLADQGYFDGVGCHRLTTQGIYVLQCGDPTGSGAGGPGYAFDDELDTATKLKPGPNGGVIYPAGAVAMANAGPGTNGSQFFLVYADSELGPDYTLFGSMDKASTKKVQAISKAGTQTGAPDGPPKKPVTMESVKAS